MKKKITLTIGDDITLDEGFEKFITQKKAVGLSQESIKYYISCYQYFKEYIGEDILCKEVNSDLVLNYINSLKDKNTVRDTSINTYLRGIRAILYFLMERGYVNRFKVELVRAEKKIKETYTDEELEILLKKPDIKNSSFAEYRNWVLICYLLGTGNRSNTVCNIKIKDLHFESHEVKLQVVKNKKQYIIPLSQTLEQTLQEYLTFRGGTPDDYLFCNIYGEQLTTDALKNCIYKYNTKRGVSKTSIHLFRHTFAKKWILNGGDIFRLQKILGHSSIDIVKEYVNMFGVDLQKNYAEFNPLDNMECMKKNNSRIKMLKK